jgi:ribonuclease P protein component
MLPAHSRLHRARDIREVSRRGRRRTRPGIAVVVLSGSIEYPTRATVIVNKSVGGAVVRNRLRRQVRHGLIRVWDQLPAGSSIVVRASRDAKDLAAHDLDSALVGAVRGAIGSSKVDR